MNSTIKTTKTNTAFCGLLSGLLLLAAGTAQTHAGLTMTNTINVTLAAQQIESGGDTSANPDVTGGLGGSILSFSGSSLTGFPAVGYGPVHLNDGDIGTGIVSGGLYTIPNFGGGH